MTSYGTGRRIRLEVELPGGIVAVTVADPSVEQAAAVNRMIDEWLRDQRGEEKPGRPPKPTSKPGPMCPHCDAGPFLSGHALPCLLCDQPFGGHEIGDSIPDPTRPPGGGVMICPACTAARNGARV